MNEREVRVKFWDAARKQLPDVGEPGIVWVMTEVLGWDFEKCKTVAIDGFSRKGYRVFLYNDDGSKIYNFETDTVKSVFREWTAEEKRLLKDWWWLLGY